ncbi:hypothetical protein B0H66DRAFT_467804 [Apodospora peruviana]|uniref:Zn(2)-C6 fungal-type domain-containing protein n=1 Tax=Apodospora peruviana TaxID=516989 RepID=A0AAE0IU75_9PEZI|nr:hypothetical protein B0H66DRAFT_467804 [Apodospora peruviana]
MQPPGLPEREFRPRRPHTKSRTGCKQCRARRIKCDEIKPRCTRCQKGDFACKYPEASPADEHFSERRSLQPRGASHRFNSCGSQQQQGDANPARAASTSSGMSMSLVSSFQFYSGTGAFSRQPVIFDSELSTGHSYVPPAPVPTGLNPEHMQLFNHYLQHTGPATTSDEEDFFAHKIGFPSLAMGGACPALMSSILAVAAACSCCDIIAHPAPIPGDRERVIDLLAQANRHHLNALREIQSTISATPRNYDQILANAMMMATYGASSQRVRVWLALTQDQQASSQTELLADEFLPHHPGWISLFYTVHAAYISVLGDHRHHHQPGHNQMAAASVENNEGDVNATYSVPAEGHQEEIVLPSGQPTNWENHPLYSILATTSASAFDTLRKRAHDLLASLSSTPTPGLLDDYFFNNDSASRGITPSSSGTATNDDPRTQARACLIALDILTSLASEVCPSAHHPTGGPLFDYDFRPSRGGHLSEVSDWLRRYLSRILAATPSRPLRRVIMAFLYRVPQTYIASVQRVLESSNTSGSRGSMSPAGSNAVSDVDGLAIDIFAHWLAFTLLLDGVWFLEDVGFWELGRIVGLVKSGRLVMGHHHTHHQYYGWHGNSRVGGGRGCHVLVDEGENDMEWWPVRIYKAAEEVRRLGEEWD